MALRLSETSLGRRAIFRLRPRVRGGEIAQFLALLLIGRRAVGARGAALCVDRRLDLPRR